MKWIKTWDSLIKESFNEYSSVTEREYYNYNRDIYENFTSLEVRFFKENFDCQFRHKDFKKNPYTFNNVSDGSESNCVICITGQGEIIIECYKMYDEYFMARLRSEPQKKINDDGDEFFEIKFEHYKCDQFDGLKKLLKDKGYLK